jgi:hypothetical protein
MADHLETWQTQLRLPIGHQYPLAKTQFILQKVELIKALKT